MKRSGNSLRGQAEAREEIRKALATGALSLRQLASRMGLTGHAALSRFLAGKQALPLETILRICEEIGLEGRPLERVLRSLLPRAFSPYVSSPSRAPTENAVTQSRVRMMRFFFNEKIPFLYETLKIVGAGTTEEIRGALHPRVVCAAKEIEACLEGLRHLGLVTKSGAVWKIVDRKRDIVVPSKNSSEIGKRILRHALGLHANYLDAPTDARVMRAVMASIGVPVGGSWVDVVKKRMLEFQDDMLDSEGAENVAVQLVISAVEVARPR